VSHWGKKYSIELLDKNMIYRIRIYEKKIVFCVHFSLGRRYTIY
jgi:hypothetical protein